MAAAMPETTSGTSTPTSRCWMIERLGDRTMPMGSSTVQMWPSMLAFQSSSTLSMLVILPEPGMPEKITRPLGLRAARRTASGMPRCCTFHPSGRRVGRIPMTMVGSPRALAMHIRPLTTPGSSQEVLIRLVSAPRAARRSSPTAAAAMRRTSAAVRGSPSVRSILPLMRRATGSPGMRNRSLALRSTASCSPRSSSGVWLIAMVEVLFYYSGIWPPGRFLGLGGVGSTYPRSICRRRRRASCRRRLTVPAGTARRSATSAQLSWSR